jgi:hypothetical protein
MITSHRCTCTTMVVVVAAAMFVLIAVIAVDDTFCTLCR